MFFLPGEMLSVGRIVLGSRRIEDGSWSTVLLELLGPIPLGRAFFQFPFLAWREKLPSDCWAIYFLKRNFNGSLDPIIGGLYFQWYRFSISGFGNRGPSFTLGGKAKKPFQRGRGKGF